MKLTNDSDLADQRHKIFLINTHDGEAYERNFRVGHALYVEALVAEETITRRCEDAGYSLDAYERKIAQGYTPRKRKPKTVREPLIKE
jgi:hypothetical protein